jgi:hypothetical protein
MLVTIAENIRLKHPQYVKLNDRELSKTLAEDGCCTHYPGYTCDKNFSDPAVCPKCIYRWLHRKIRKVDV